MSKKSEVEEKHVKHPVSPEKHAPRATPAKDTFGIDALNARIKELEAEIARHKGWASRQKRTVR